MRQRWWLIFSIIFLWDVGCGAPSPEKEIKEILVQREKALETRNLSQYLEIISPSYGNKRAVYKSLKEKIVQNFELFDKIEFTTTRQSIYVQGNSATVIQHYTLSFETPQGKKSLAGEERLLLHPEKNGWKIIGGL